MTTIQRPIAVMNIPGNRTSGPSTLFVTPPPGTDTAAPPGFKITWNLTVMAGAIALAVGLIRGPRWLAYAGGAVAGFYGVVYPNFIAGRQ